VSAETDTKVERVARIALEAGAGGVLLTAQRNFTWLTGGGSNRIDGSRELGAGALLVRADGRRFALANVIEMPRLQAEPLVGLGFEPIEYPWTDDQANPAAVANYARVVLPGSAALAADWPLPGVTVVEPALMRSRVALVDEEIGRYRALGRDMGRVVGDVCRALRPGVSEQDIANTLSAAVHQAGARPVVVLIAADDRLARFRHPVAAGAVWRNTVMVVLCAERHGLVAALSRVVSTGAVDAKLHARTHATARVFEQLLEATRAGTSGAQLFAAAARAYEEAGFAGEEQRHHQGGATGYRSREWIAHPRSEEIVQPREAFAWNPSITGSKIEDTVLVIDGRIELITTTPLWPVISLRAQEQTIEAADVLPI
jgi:Xaa-Pro dipeptidase